jgi:RNA polymerase sigma factor (sigma-70 family)
MTDTTPPTDAELIAAFRSGQTDAFGTLYTRHVAVAYSLARQFARSHAESEDLVSEAFARVLHTMRGGGGPESAFRGYLLNALRHVAYDKMSRDRKIELTDDVTAVSGVRTERISEPFRDTALAGLECSLAAKAFAVLPERWQTVLWHIEIQGLSAADVAPILGLAANGVYALTFRARDGLRVAYLHAHLAATATPACRATRSNLAAWTRHKLTKHRRASVEAHLDTCPQCRSQATQIAEINAELRHPPKTLESIQ